MQWLLLLTQYFTRIPVNKELDYSPENFRIASYFYTLHTAFIGLIPMALSLGMKLIGVPVIFNALITLTLILFLTGALHLDGFADTVDGLFSGRSRERILEIMKDPTMGSYGTVAIVLNLAFKTFILFELIVRNQVYLIPLIMASGKIGVALAGHIGKQAKVDSSANLVIGNIPAPSVLVNTGLTLILAFVLGEILSYSLALVTLYLMTLLVTWYCHKKLNGLVGDNMGFIAELGEIIVGVFLVSL